MGGWKETGDPLTLTVGVQGAAGDVTYQWVKDGEYLEGQTSSTFSIPSLDLDDRGYYSCIVEDDNKTPRETPPAYISVFPAGSLPASRTFLGLVAATAIGCIGVLALLRRKQIPR
jgi:hypothetical protein